MGYYNQYGKYIESNNQNINKPTVIYNTKLEDEKTTNLKNSEFIKYEYIEQIGEVPGYFSNEVEEKYYTDYNNEKQYMNSEPLKSDDNVNYYSDEELYYTEEDEEENQADYDDNTNNYAYI